MRTVWDLLTDPTLEAQVSHPQRPSHALVALPSDWQISVLVAPAPQCSLGQQFAQRLEQPVTLREAVGHEGSPEGWFDRARDAEVAIIRPDGTWYPCESNDPDDDPDRPQSWGHEGVEGLAQLIERVRTQPAGCLCPDCLARS